MTDEKKIEEQAPEQGEEKVEAVVLDENVLEQLLVGCIWVFSLPASISGRSTRAER